MERDEDGEGSGLISEGSGERSWEGKRKMEG